MDTSYEKISKNNSTSQGKTDANLANDSNHLGGIEAEDYATKKYVQEYHDNKESSLKEYLDNQDNVKLGEAKEYANSLVRNQDFSDFAKTSDINALNTKLSNTISSNATEQKNYTDNKVQDVVNDVNNNFEDVNNAITKLNTNQTELFQSVSDGKTKIAGAITDKGVLTSATDTFQTMADNISQITTSSGGSGTGEITIPEGYVDTSDATADESKILLGYSAYSKGQKILGTFVSGGSSGSGDSSSNPEVIEIYKTSNPTFEVANMGIGRILEYDEDNKEYTGRVLMPVGVYAISKNGKNIVYETKMYDVGKEDIKFMTATDSEVEASTFVGRYIETRYLADDGVSITSSMKSRYSFEELGLNTESDINGMSFGIDGFNGESTLSLLCVVQESNAHFFVYDATYSGEIVNLANYHWQISTASYQAISIPAGANLSPNSFGCFAIDSNGRLFVLVFSFDTDANIVKMNSTQMSKDYGCTLFYNSPTFFSNYDNYLICFNDASGVSNFYGSIIFLTGINNSGNEYKTKSNRAWLYLTGVAKPTTAAISNDEQYALVNSTIYDLSYDATNSIPKLTSLFSLDINLVGTDVDGNSGSWNPEAWFSPGNEYLYVRYRNYLYRYVLDFENNTATKDLEWIFPSGYSSKGSCVFDNDGAIHLTAGEIKNLNRLCQTGGTKKLIGVKYKGSEFYLTGESEESQSSGAFGEGEGGGEIR